ncbi:c-type cytochrome [Bosea sp. NPDC055594]
MTAIAIRRQKRAMAFRRALGLLALGGTLLAAEAGRAQGVGDARAGREVATLLCIQCHQIDGAGRDPGRMPPGFGAIADMTSQTALSLRIFLQTPHGNMPRYQLTRDEIDDVVAYILSLRAR